MSLPNLRECLWRIQTKDMAEPNLQACLRGDRLAQKYFFECFKGKMFALCLRYANSREDAEDVLQEGFVKVFRDLNQYTGAGNFEGWVRKVFVNTALQHLQKQKKNLITMELDGQDFPDEPETYLSDEPPAKNMIRILQQLPTGYRTIFNLHILEGYSHPEIAEILDISVGTSKSQLLRAKVHFRKLLEGSLTT
ncbi:MAG: sigma-70 family RNA polymerase sigma factor [Saprospiraceae bacterium]|nr:sigma-70 family RNA polymerase sigma factor [Saprospiraceae bacterium]